MYKNNLSTEDGNSVLEVDKFMIKVSLSKLSILIIEWFKN